MYNSDGNIISDLISNCVDFVLENRRFEFEFCSSLLFHIHFYWTKRKYMYKKQRLEMNGAKPSNMYTWISDG